MQRKHLMCFWCILGKNIRDKKLRATDTKVSVIFSHSALNFYIPTILRAKVIPVILNFPEFVLGENWEKIILFQNFL